MEGDEGSRAGSSVRVKVAGLRGVEAGVMVVTRAAEVAAVEDEDPGWEAR